MARIFDINEKLVWCNDTMQMEKRIEVRCGIATNLGTVLSEKLAYVKTISEAFMVRDELDADCLNSLQNRSPGYE